MSNEASAWVRYQCPACDVRLKIGLKSLGKRLKCPKCKADCSLLSSSDMQTKQVATAPLMPVVHALPAPEPPKVDQELFLQLYDLLRDEPTFVDWYLTGCKVIDGRWHRRVPPAGVFWARWWTVIVLSWIVSFSGVGLAVSVPFGIYLFWRFHNDQFKYREWRTRVDSLVNQLGFADAVVLMERAPKFSGFRQFAHFAGSLIGATMNVSGASQADAED